MAQTYQRDISGVLVWGPSLQQNGTLFWEGFAINGFAVGMGKLTWKYNGTTTVYDGEMEMGKPHGNGKYVFANGDTYDGEWQNGLRHGHGTQTDINGIYTGEWENDQPKP